MGDMSYRMRMYKRRMYQERARIILIGTACWSLLAVIIIAVTI